MVFVSEAVSRGGPRAGFGNTRGSGPGSGCGEDQVQVVAIRPKVELDRNPLKVKPDEIKDIQVLRTIKRGKSVYTKSP